MVTFANYTERLRGRPCPLGCRHQDRRASVELLFAGDVLAIADPLKSSLAPRLACRSLQICRERLHRDDAIAREEHQVVELRKPAETWDIQRSVKRVEPVIRTMGQDYLEERLVALRSDEPDVLANDMASISG